MLRPPILFIRCKMKSLCTLAEWYSLNVMGDEAQRIKTIKMGKKFYSKEIRCVELALHAATGNSRIK